MSSVRICAIRPLNGILRSNLERPGLAQARLFRQSNQSTPNLCRSTEVLVLLRCQQTRHQSSGGKKFPEQQPPSSSSALLLRALRQSLSIRPLIGAFRGQSLQRLYRQSPEELVIALALLAGLSVIIVYVIYTYFNYFQSEQFTKFPPDVAKSMRRALYYSNYSPDPKLALKYYKMALEQCDRNGIDPFSDGVMGIKIQLAAWLEKIGSYKNSIDVLEVLLRDCKTWIAKMEKYAHDGLIDKDGNLIESTNAVAVKTDGKVEGSDADDAVQENLWGKRTRVLGKSVGISVKLGELYADEHVLQGETAGERLVWAVETVLKELQRRQAQGVKLGEGEWMSPEQIGGALEALANHYESKDQHYLAAPLYLQALTLSPSKSCHTAVLMNNLAISLAQQPVTAADSSVPTNQARPTRASLLASARSWALQAHATGSKVTGEERTEECDTACAVALCNLGEIAAMMGDMEEARARFKQSLGLSRRIGFEAGVTQAEDGLAATSLKISPKSP
ncbi:putative TPR domain-containing protein [Seiridium unicorne]|uniref:TPR domain-containing protein n=1 Tax=Seiridium unicorne TaxID=138068 RepID=A0ABR2V4U8_9PEZI